MHLSLPPYLFLFAQSLRQSVKNDNPIVRGPAFARGLSYGLRVKTLAGMAACSETHVRRMLHLLELPTQDVIAISEGAPYTPLIRPLRSGGCLPEVRLPESILSPIGS
jgi:hypothetical protein